MLAPGNRTLLLDALRPPEGYRLDQAVGTTFTLDLQALLLPPLAFALFDWATDEDARSNPVALFEAVRRNAERMTVFCQAGHIGVPTSYRSVLVYLEDAVVEVVPPDRDRIFHPKLWALKFSTEDGEPAYRLVCLSRNLTFDRAWDTVLVLDGIRASKGRRQVQKRNRPLADFISALPGIATRSMGRTRSDAIAALAEELREVAFEAPEGYENIAFHPLGLGKPSPRVAEEGDRVLVISPFLTQGMLTRLTSSGRRHALVSRQESLDAVGSTALDGFEKTFVLAPHAWAELAAEGESRDVASAGTAATEESVAEARGTELTGLHAKLFVVQRPNLVRVFTGSANATDAAFNGNVEFLVELATNAYRVHIDRLLTPGGEEGTFGDLLESYTPPQTDPPPATDEQEVQRSLDVARRELASCHFIAQLDQVGDSYQLRLEGRAPQVLQLTAVEKVHCWPTSLGAGTAVAPMVDGTGLQGSFGTVSPQSVTSFFAFELVGRVGNATDSVRLVVNVELQGGPQDRREYVLLDVLRSRSDVLRYLMFLLSEGGVDAQSLADALAGDPSGGHSEARGSIWDAPLFESMVRALVEDPGRLDHLGRVISDLRRSGQGEELLPAGLEAVWAPIWETRKGLAK